MSKMSCIIQSHLLSFSFLSFVLLLCFSFNSPLVISQIHMGVYKRTGHYASLFASNYNQVPKYTFNKTERYITIRANCKEILTKDTFMRG